MSRTLTTPITQPATTQQAITRLYFEVPHVRDDTDSFMELEVASIRVKYEVTTYNADGGVESKMYHTVSLADWPPAYKTAMNTVYNMTATDAENEGLLLGPGSDELLS